MAESVSCHSRQRRQSNERRIPLNMGQLCGLGTPLLPPEDCWIQEEGEQ